MNFFWLLGLICLSLGRCMDGFVDFEEWVNDTEAGGSESSGVGSNVLNVSITLIPNDKGAACMDGSPPAYHLHRGFGSGANNWIVNLEGGGWCNDISTCNYRKSSRRGSSYYMEKEIPFTGIMSDKPEQNLDFFNWNRVKVRYCDGASFTGEGFDMVGLFFRGQRIYQVAMEELMSKGMRYAKQALLAGCSAGGLATVHHCDEFRALFSGSTNVKCLADAGLFMDAVDVAGGRTLRSFFGGVVSMQGSGRNLPRACTSRMDATLCFFPQNVVQTLQTPMFILNAAYDVWQLRESLAPSSVDPHGYWNECKRNHSTCNADQIQFLQGFRDQMLDAVRGFSMSRQNGLFINSCFAHCQMERQDTWFAIDGPQIGNQGIAKAVGDWYFDRSAVMAVDCPYPCDQTCHHLVARRRD